MPLKANSSFENISTTIEAIYEASTDQTVWPRALEQMADLLGGMFASIAFQDTSGRFPSYHFGGVGSLEIMRPYAEYYRQVDPVLTAACRAPPLMVVTDRMVMSRSEATRTEIYADFAVPRGIETVAHAFPICTPDLAYFVAVCRSMQAGEFETEDLRILHLLLPHLGRAMRVHLRLEHATIRLQGAIEALNRLTYGVLWWTKPHA